MDDVARPQRLSTPLSLPLTGAIVGGAAVLLGFLLVPQWRLEQAVSASGIPAILAAAEPPLGFTARIGLGLVFGGMVAAFAWFGLNLLAAGRRVTMPQWQYPGRYRLIMARWSALLRRTGTSGDHAPRPPLSAQRELGTPFLDVRAPVAPPPEQDLPLDLDQPLAAFDPGALPQTPLPVPAPVAPLAPAPVRPQLIDPGDRFETFELTPVQRIDSPPLRSEPAPVETSAPPAAPERVVAPETESSIHALLERLERGVARAAVPAEASTAEVGAAPVEAKAADQVPPTAPAIRAGSLQDTLGDLRRLAMGGS